MAAQAGDSWCPHEAESIVELYRVQVGTFNESSRLCVADRVHGVLQILESVTTQLRQQAAGMLLVTLSDSKRLQLHATNAFAAFYWLSTARDTDRLKSALQAAGIPFQIQCPSNQMLLEEPEVREGKKRKSKHRHSKKHKKRDRAMSEESKSMALAELFGASDGSLSESVWMLNGSSNQLLTKDVQQTLIHTLFCRCFNTRGHA